MTIIQLDTSIKNDEGIVHQFMKKSIWYNITKEKEGNVFYIKSSEHLRLKNKKAYLEYEIKLNNQKIIPDISIFDDEGNLETVIECIDTSRPSLTKYECYINSNINIIFINSETTMVKGFNGGYIQCELIVLKGTPNQFRYLALLKSFTKLTNRWNQGIYRYIGKFENDDTYFLFGIDKNKDIYFFTSTNYSYGTFSKSNSKKVPILLKDYVEKFLKNEVIRTIDYKGQLYVPREEYMMGIRRYDRKKINYWDLL